MQLPAVGDRGAVLEDAMWHVALLAHELDRLQAAGLGDHRGASRLEHPFGAEESLALVTLHVDLHDVRLDFSSTYVVVERDHINLAPALGRRGRGRAQACHAGVARL